MDSSQDHERDRFQELGAGCGRKTGSRFSSSSLTVFLSEVDTGSLENALKR
jgi:hypothetical protein